MKHYLLAGNVELMLHDREMRRSDSLTIRESSSATAMS